MDKLFKILWIVFIIVLNATSIFAQPGGPGGLPSGPPVGGGAGVPIDGGILTFLLGAGIAYLVGKNKKKNNFEN